MKTRRALTVVIIVTMIWFLVLLAACGQSESTPTAPPTISATAEPDVTPQPSQEGDGPAAGMATSVAARTPIPTPTPGRIEQSVDNVADRMGWSGDTFLGLSAIGWADFIAAVLIIVAGYFVARILVNRVLVSLAKRTPTGLDDALLNRGRRHLRWFIVLIVADYAINGLAFLSDRARTIVNDVLFLLTLVLLTSMALGLIQDAAEYYKANIDSEEDQERLTPVITAGQRIAGFVVLLLAFSLGLAHYGASANTLYLTLLFAALVASLAARDVITDALSGFIILVDQPFREGDSVHIKDLDTWGDVLDIGTRTTRLRTRDNRELIVPNSQIAKSQIVNYNYPDTEYRLRSELRIAYGIDFDQVRNVATRAVRGVKGVLEEKPVDVWFMQFGDSSRIVRVDWWISSFHDERPAMDAVNIALEKAFMDAQIDLPYETYDVHVHIEDGEDKDQEM